MSRHIAFFNIPALGHLYPTLAVIAELARRGHRVTATSTETRRPALEAMGATVVPYTSTRPADTDPDIAAVSGTGYVGRSLLNFLAEMEVTLPQIEPYYAADPPDLIVHDRMAFAARVLAAKLGVPTVETWAVLISNEHWSLFTDANAFDPADPNFLAYLHRLGQLLASHGLAVKPADFLAPVAARQLAFFPRSFQYRGELFGDQYEFVGPCPRPTEVEADWQPPAGDRPVVLITFGSLHNRQPDFYRLCFEAFADSPWHVVLNIGARFDPAVLGPAPANVELHRFVPQLRVLAHARAFVSHGGMNGIMEALNAGVPQVAIPFTPEQEANAVRLVQLGIGARRSLDGLTPQTLRAAVDRLGTDETMATRIAAARQELATTGGPARAADVIEACLPAARVAAPG